MNEGKTILIVDDSENDLLLMGAAFNKAGCNYNLQEVRNGEEAIAYLKGVGPYADRQNFPLPIVILLDLNMPKMNGFDFLVWVRAQPGLKRLSIIVLTASMREEDLERVFDSGATAFLVKPSSFESLIDMMRCLSDWIQVNQFPPLH